MRKIVMSEFELTKNVRFTPSSCTKLVWEWQRQSKANIVAQQKPVYLREFQFDCLWLRTFECILLLTRPRWNIGNVVLRILHSCMTLESFSVFLDRE